jgi:hypothetical protein
MNNPFLKYILNKEFILKHITQEQIFEYYTGCRVIFNKFYHAPHRKDPKPSFSYKKKGNDIICMDFGDNSMKGDCFNCVAYLKNISYNDTFKIIANDFNLFGNNVNFNVNTDNLKYKKEKYEEEKEEKELIPIQVKKIPWTKELLQFWIDFGWTKELLDFYEVNPISHYWYNGEIRIINSICYAYRFAPYEYKLYFPYENDFRFRCNTTRLQGYNQLDKTGKLLILNKSLKDVGLLRRFNINSVATQAEGNFLLLKDYEDLNNRFDNIISIYDFDYQGVISSGKIKRRYNIPRTMLTNGKYGIKRNYGAKDLSDFYKKYGIDKFKKLLNYKFGKYFMK